MDEAKVTVAATHNAAADHFDAGPLAFRDRYGRRTVERLHLAPGARVLDVGCGSGASAIPAAQSVGAGGRVIGVDLAEKLLALAQAKAAALKLNNVVFRQADMEALGAPSDAFDAVISVFSIFFAPDMVTQARELWRMVRPGGKLAITIWGPRMFEPGSAAWWAAVKSFRPDLVPASKPWERITTPYALEKLLADSGIGDADVVAESGQQPLQSVDDWWTVVLGSGYRGTVEQMDKELAAQVREANLKALHYIGVKAIETNVIYAVAMKR